jgi:hypothetical protein
MYHIMSLSCHFQCTISYSPTLYGHLKHSSILCRLDRAHTYIWTYTCVCNNQSLGCGYRRARSLSLLIIYDVESNGRDYTPCRCSTVNACIRSPCSMVHVQFESVRKQTYKVIIIDIQYPMVLGRKRSCFVSRCFWRNAEFIAERLGV